MWDIARPIKPEEMIGEFLKAELHSSRFRKGSLRALEILGYDDNLVENPNYTDTEQNEKRAKVLGLCRGWPNKELFSSFPVNTEWFIGTIEQDELARAYRLKSTPEMTDNERLLSVTAQKLQERKTVRNIDTELIHQIAAAIKQGKTIPPIILVSEDLEGKKVLLEGHSRSTAYTFLGQSQAINNIPAIIGISPDMSEWAYY